MLPLLYKQIYIDTQITSLYKFRTNQTEILLRVIKGETFFLTSRVGNFRLIPVSAEEKIAVGIKEGVNEVERIEDGVMPGKKANVFLDEL